MTPSRIASLPVDGRGYPVPWFVAWIDGVPDFRVIGPGKVERAVRLRACWICGQTLGSFQAFVVGSMCAVNRVSAEPPSHRECAIYAATHCPFLTKPRMRRRDSRLPEGTGLMPGIAIPRNPGVALVWITRRYERFLASTGPLFDVGNPTEVLWYAEGRLATRSEVWASIESGLPILAAEAEAEGPDAVAELGRLVERAMPFLPTEAVA